MRQYLLFGSTLIFQHISCPIATKISMYKYLWKHNLSPYTHPHTHTHSHTLTHTHTHSHTLTHTHTHTHTHMHTHTHTHSHTLTHTHTHSHTHTHTHTLTHTHTHTYAHTHTHIPTQIAFMTYYMHYDKIHVFHPLPLPSPPPSHAGVPVLPPALSSPSPFFYPVLDLGTASCTVSKVCVRMINHE